MSSLEINHEWDEGGHCAIGVVDTTPNYSLSLLDLAGVLLTTVGGHFGVINQGFNMLAREFYAAGEYRRRRRAEREQESAAEEARREMAASLDGLLMSISPEAPE